MLSIPSIIEPTLSTLFTTPALLSSTSTLHSLGPQNQKFEGAQTGYFSAADLGVKIGCANGVRPDGSPQNPDDTHQLEVWTGINFGLAAFFAHAGKQAEAMEITQPSFSKSISTGYSFAPPKRLLPLAPFAPATTSTYGNLGGVPYPHR